MAKPIKMTPEIQQQCILDFTKRLAEARMTGRGFEYKKTFEYEVDMKAKVHYTQKAWYKTIMLVETQGKEVGWHGVCRRDPNDDTRFVIEDIIVYPQAVTGATITPDPKEYNLWMEGLDDDTYNNMRFHGHSHVNMAVSPSGTDMTFRSDRLGQLGEDDYYIFQIFNKRGEISTEVYDYRNNILYESKDVDTVVDCGDGDMKMWETYKTVGKMLLASSVEDLQPAINLFKEAGTAAFLEEAKALVVEHKPTYGAGQRTQGYSGGSYGGYSGYGGYNGGCNGGYSSGYNGGYISGYGGGHESRGYESERKAGLRVLSDSKSSEEYKGRDDATRRMLADPLGYMDEGGRFHGSNEDEYDDPLGLYR